MPPASHKSVLEQERLKMEKELEDVVLSLSCIHQEMADFMEEYDANNKRGNMHDRAKMREKEDTRATEFVKKFKSVLQVTKQADEIRMLQGCFDRWNMQVLPELKKKPERVEVFVGIPLKMAGLYYFYGDYYRALNSLKTVLSLQPFNMEARTIMIKWTVYLGELEIAEGLLAKEEKDLRRSKMIPSQQALLKTLHRVSTAYVKFCRKEDKETSMEVISEELKRLEQKNENSYPAKEMSSFLWFMCSHFGKIPDPAQSTLDPLHCIFKSYLDCNILISNKLAGVFKENKRLNLVQLLRDPIACLETLVYVAEYCDRVRDCALEYFNMGLVREGLAMAENGLKLAYKLGCFPRALEFANLSCLIMFDVSSVSSTLSLSVVKARLQILMPGEVRASASPARPKSPSRTTSKAAQKMLESFEELQISEDTRPKRMHNVDYKCRCDVCVLYFKNCNTAINYIWALFLYHGINEQAFIQMHTEFAQIRKRVMSLQQQLLGKEERPRPPLWMCEVFCSSAVRWLRHCEQNGRLYLADEKKAATRNTLLEGAIKVAEYSRLRLICYLLALRQFKRQGSLGGKRELDDFSWMHPPMSGNESTISRHSQPNLSSENLGDPEKALGEAIKDFDSFSHLLYRDWRFPICTFIARHSTDPWQSAMMWNESTVLSTRQQARLKTGKLDVVGFSRKSSFQAAMRRVPADFTVVQLATDENGAVWLVKLFSERDPIIIPICDQVKVTRVRRKFQALMKENDDSESATKGGITARKFWDNRRDIDSRLGQAVKSAQIFLFNAWASFLLPSHSLAARGQKLASSLIKCSSLPKAMAEELVSIAIHIENPAIWNDVVAAVGQYCKLPADKVKYLRTVYAKLRKEAISPGSVNKHPTMFTLLALSPILSLIPFETMDIFEKRPHVGRIISIHALLKQLTKATSLPRRVDMTNSYYVLDPDNCLLDTQKRMTDFLKKLQLNNGLVGGAPSTSELQSVLEDKDMFFYFGHGSGSKHWARKTVKNSNCNAVSVLMGCSSVNLDYDGWALDGKCTVYDYTLAHCPAIIGCLWMVTDGEIDRYFMELMNSCFSDGANTTMDGGAPRLRNIMDAMRKAREQAKLPYLTGAAVVCYGLPVASCDLPQ